jgi:hypothetical protein
VQEISTLVANLPIKCPVDKFNTDPSLTPLVTESTPIEKGIDCSMYVPASGVFVSLVYTKVTQEEWEASMARDGGRPTILGLGESAAYTYSVPETELDYGFEATIVNFHGIMIHSDLPFDSLSIAIEAIPRSVL